MTLDSTARSTQTLTQRPRPYGVAKKPLRRRWRSTLPGDSLNAIDGRAFTISNVQKVFVPARKFGWPQDSVSAVSGNARHRRRTCANTGLSKIGFTAGPPQTLYASVTKCLGKPRVRADSVAADAGTSGARPPPPAFARRFGVASRCRESALAFAALAFTRRLATTSMRHPSRGTKRLRSFAATKTR
jgi:hypothetical protein